MAGRELNTSTSWSFHPHCPRHDLDIIFNKSRYELRVCTFNWIFRLSHLHFGTLLSDQDGSSSRWCASTWSATTVRHLFYNPTGRRSWIIPDSSMCQRSNLLCKTKHETDLCFLSNVLRKFSGANGSAHFYAHNLSSRVGGISFWLSSSKVDLLRVFYITLIGENGLEHLTPT